MGTSVDPACPVANALLSPMWGGVWAGVWEGVRGRVHVGECAWEGVCGRVCVRGVWEGVCRRVCVFA